MADANNSAVDAPEVPGSVSFAPRPGAAPRMRQVLAQAGMEARLMVRNGEQLLIAVAIPIIVLIGAVLGAERMNFGITGRPIDAITPGILALAIMSTSFTSVAIATGFERRYGVIKRLGATPLSRAGLLAGKILALLIIEVGQVLIIGALAYAMGWQPANGWAAAFVIALAGTFAFASLGLAIAGILRAEATLAAANLIYLLLLAGGAVVLPATTYGSIGGVLNLLPSGALGEGMRAALSHGVFSGTEVVVMVIWGLVGTVTVQRTFKWD